MTKRNAGGRFSPAPALRGATLKGILTGFSQKGVLTMSEPLAEAKSLFKSIRVTLAVAGVLALIAGIVLLVWPVKSAVIVTAIFASYLIVAGLVYVGLGIFSSAKGGWARVGHIVLGLLYIAAGVIAFFNLNVAAATLAFVVVIFIGVSWIVDGIVALSLLGSDGSRVWTVLYAILSIVAGIIVLFSPLIAGFAFWLLLGISLVVLGIIQIVRAITLGRDAKEYVSAVQGGATS
ncbi:hypothetical protein MOX01_21490 [Microbacterium oxydans]|nr:hypothetical protein MOX01_21490 [Microbacterium oxydans]